MRQRLLLAGALAGVSLLLFGIQALDPSAGSGSAGAADRRNVQQQVATAIDTLLGSHGIDPREARVWTAPGPGKTSGRVEERVIVPPSFVSLDFNHRLNLALAPLGAHVVATERTRENTVTMHIVSNGKTIRSLILVREG